MEHFDFTLFLAGTEKRNKKEIKMLLKSFGLNIWKNAPAEYAQNPILSGREIVVEKFSDKDFCTVCICIPGLFITRENVLEMFRLLAELANRGFNVSENVLFATGIYELTYYYLEGATRLADLTPDRMMNFPLRFFRIGDAPAENTPAEDIVFSFPGVSLQYNPRVQDIFDTPFPERWRIGLTMSETDSSQSE